MRYYDKCSDEGVGNEVIMIKWLSTSDDGGEKLVSQHKQQHSDLTRSPNNLVGKKIT